MDFGNLGRILIIAGIILAGLGTLLVYGFKIPWLGHLPGDFVIKRESFTLYLPITTCVVLSLLLTLIVRIFRGPR